jgi:hypothetical protein
VTGVFALGDVRSESVKRVGAAIGAGATVVQQIHAFLESERTRRSGQPVQAGAALRGDALTSSRVQPVLVGTRVKPSMSLPLPTSAPDLQEEHD